MRDTGVGSRSDWPSLRQRFLEEKRVQRKHCKGAPMRAMYFIYWMLYMPYRAAKALLLSREVRSGPRAPIISSDG
jgi:hypothetical protein